MVALRAMRGSKALVGSDDGTETGGAMSVFILDFYCPECKIGIGYPVWHVLSKHDYNPACENCREFKRVNVVDYLEENRHLHECEELRLFMAALFMRNLSR